jgi:single-strand DNA-binding protein
VRGIEGALIGIAGSEPELKMSKAGKPYCSFSVGVDAGEDDEGKERLEWVRCTCFGPVAERLAATLHKGEKVYAEGNLRLDRWEAKDGQQRFGLSMACFKAEKIGSSAIGRNKPKREADQNNGTITASSFAGPHVGERAPAQSRDRFDFDDRMPF